MIVVNKLGGSCLRTVEDFAGIARILTKTPCILVVSAASNTTSILSECLELASEHKDYKEKINDLIDLHCALSHTLTKEQSIYNTLLRDKDDILALLHSINLVGAYTPYQNDWLLGYGEYWSSTIIASMLHVPWIDAGQMITIETYEGIIHVDWKETTKRFTKALKNNQDPIIVMPGFVARDKKGHRALLGLNGSDFSAAIIAKVFKASYLCKWTDIDGIYTANPEFVKSAFAIEQLSYQEAIDLAYFGASVLHPQSIQPLIETEIPIYIKNYFNTQNHGTKISATPIPSSQLVKGFSSIPNVSLINIEGTGVVGVCTIAVQIFGVLKKANIPIIFISHSSSEYSISIVVDNAFANQAVLLLKHELEIELKQGMIKDIVRMDCCSIVSAIGDKMAGLPGVAGKFFSMLGKANINVKAVAQGSSERNISVVIDTEQTIKALRVLHGGFYLSNKTLSIGVIGPGGIGTEFIRQIQANRMRLKDEFNVDLKIRGIMNSKAMILDDNLVEMQDWNVELTQNSKTKNMDDFLSFIASPEIPHAVIVDCTSSTEITTSYNNMLKVGCHIVTPNKKANSSEISAYNALKKCIKDTNRYYLYETTVCAGLPVIKTIQDLMITGDTILRIEGIVSGTLSYIFNRCGKGGTFADSVLEAYKLGYTETDPREDLYGLDVARKFICLARELGYNINLEDVTLLDLVPPHLKDVSIKEFLNELPQHQDIIDNMIKKILKTNAVVAYVGVIEHGKITIQLNGYPSTHVFANTQGTDNILLIQSHRYDKQPLIIQGPGAGKDVTAAGVFADLMKLAAML